MALSAMNFNDMLKKKKKDDPEVHAMDDNNQGIEPEPGQENAEKPAAAPQGNGPGDSTVMLDFGKEEKKAS